MSMERFPLRWEARLRDAVESVRGDRSVNICITRAVEQWVARELETQGRAGETVPRRDSPSYTRERGTDGRREDPTTRPTSQDAPSPESARRRRPAASRAWGSSR
jgi:hypothetical protein